MSDRDALLAAVRQAPADDAPRLVYADWLDEHDEADRAQFIRLQIEIDPLRRPDSELDRWRRAVIDRHPDEPVPADFPPELHRYAALARREDRLLEQYRWEWLGPLAAVYEDVSSHLAPTFRRGFAEEVALTASAFLESGDLVRAACPVLRRLTLYGPRDQVPELAGMAALGGIPELELADWLTAYDARFLAGSFALRGVESLTLWVGSRHDPEVVRTLASRPWDGGPGPAPPTLLTSPHLGGLREVVLVQLHGGLLAEDAGGALDRRANGLAGEFNRVLGRPVARVERPFARRFPLYARVGYDLFAGNVRGRPAIVCGGRQPVVLQFDSSGGQTHEDVLDLDDRLRKPPVYSWATCDEREMLDVLRREHGFELGPLFVREFASEEADLSVQPWGNYEDVVADPDGRSDGDEHEEACASLGGYWMRGGNFVVLFGNDYWAGPDGTIHTS
jgi:uncharacterized protein (TIGR02996 family)